MMFTPLRAKALGLVLIVGITSLAVPWILGKNFRPWVSTVRLSAREQLEQLVDKYRFEMAKAQTAVADARKRVEAVRGALADTTAGIRAVENDLKLARHEVEEAKTQLAGMEQRLTAGQPVRLVSGRTLSTEEITIRAQDYGQRIDLANQKIAFLEDMLKRRQERKEKLARLNTQAPLELARLELSVRHLAAKVKLYEEQRARFEEEKDAETAVAGLFEQAQQTLEAAHTEVDHKLAEFDAMLDASLDTKVAPATEAATAGGDALSEIRRILGRDRPVAAREE